MKIRRSRIALITLLLFITVIFMRKLFPQKVTWTSPLMEVSPPPRLNIQDPLKFANETDFSCIDVTLTDIHFPMCLYTAKEDIYVSNSFILGGYFESHMAVNFVNILKDRDDVTYLDIGANLGSYCLPVARLGKHVIAIEPNWNTLRRFSKSVFLGGVASNVDILFNAIGSKRSTTVLKFDPSNRGNTVLMNNVTCKEKCENLNISVSIVTLNDLIPIMRNKKAVMKVDTEGTEIDIFTSSGASEFFRVIDVFLIQVEWMFYGQMYSQSPEKRQLIDNFLKFFYERNYSVIDINLGQKLDQNWTNWPDNVYFKKSEVMG